MLRCPSRLAPSRGHEGGDSLETAGFKEIGDGRDEPPMARQHHGLGERGGREAWPPRWATPFDSATTSKKRGQLILGSR